LGTGEPIGEPILARLDDEASIGENNESIETSGEAFFLLGVAAFIRQVTHNLKWKRAARNGNHEIFEKS
jgi:hypothetical protein